MVKLDIINLNGNTNYNNGLSKNDQRSMVSMCQLPGCIFENFGRIPESAYVTDVFNSPLEEAIYSNDINRLNLLLRDGHKIDVQLTIGNMTCLEYASMKGYDLILHTLVHNSACRNVLANYFSLEDMADRAYLISCNKNIFFNEKALKEANRYLASLYTAIAYNQPKCIKILASVLGKRDLLQSNFFHIDYEESVLPTRITPLELAQQLNHDGCREVLLEYLR